MDISKYREKHSLTQADFAELVGVSPGMVHQWEKGVRPVNERRCQVILAKTCGEVTLRDLRPKDWQEIWPGEAAALGYA